MDCHCCFVDHFTHSTWRKSTTLTFWLVWSTVRLTLCSPQQVASMDLFYQQGNPIFIWSIQVFRSLLDVINVLMQQHAVIQFLTFIVVFMGLLCNSLSVILWHAAPHGWLFFSVPQQSGSFQYQQQIFGGGCEFGSTAVSQSDPTRSPRDHSAGQCSQYIYTVPDPLLFYMVRKWGNQYCCICEFAHFYTIQSLIFLYWFIHYGNRQNISQKCTKIKPLLAPLFKSGTHQHDL